MSSAAVIGSGQCGLISAERLAREGVEVTLIERLPALGGQEPEADIGRLVNAVRDAGVRCEMGCVAVRFEDGDLQTLGVNGAARRHVDVLVTATGTRPATRGELGIAGARCAGVVAGSVAVHLTASGVLLGYDPVVLGGGQLASECADILLRAGARRVTVVAPNGLLTEFPKGVETHEGWMITHITGSLGRVSSVTLDSPGETLSCDAVILAHQRRPTRNIEGAAFDGEGIVFCYSSADPKREQDARQAAEAAVTQVSAILASAGPASSRSASTREA
jgi:pyruvate/2-oxoglutarate dehydrogenase complex dihydrolipoamide dehydrogenase (E3) component